MFSIYDTITKDAPAIITEDEDCIKLGTQPKASSKNKVGQSRSHDVIASTTKQSN